MPDKPGELPKGLISFAYNAMFNPAINVRARADLMQEMSKFGLSDEARALIYAAQICGIPDQEYEERLVKLLTLELMAKWNDLRFSPASS